jgi:hypothetical protein
MILNEMVKQILPSPESKFPIYVLKFGLAFVFLYAAYAQFVRPLDWVGYFPSYVRGYIPDNLMLNMFSIGEVLLALWIVSGWRAYIASLLGAVAFLGITVTNLSVLDVTFRDVGLASAALALAFLTMPKRA